MAGNRSRFEITPGVIDLGDKIVALRQVTSVHFGSGHPYRLAGVVLVLAALGFIGNEAWAGKALDALKTGGSTRLWGAFIAAGLGIFAIVLPRRELVIALSDGSKLRFRRGRAEFLAKVVRQIRAAIEAGGRNAPHVVVDLDAGTIEAAGASGQMPGGGAQLPASDAFVPLPHERTGPADRTGPPYRNGHVNGIGHAGAEAEIARGQLAARTMPAQASPYGPAHAGAAGPAMGAGIGYGAAMPAAQASMRAPPPSPIRDLDLLIDLVNRADIQHKPALLELLRVAADHVKGGPTRREDAVAHWRSFADYVQQYLSGVDGLAAATERAGRAF